MIRENSLSAAELAAEFGLTPGQLEDRLCLMER
jgi:hypothetical protein